MPFNGAGVAAPPGADYPAVSLTVISSTVRNALDTDIYSCLSNCITKDGQQTVTANIPMAGFKITGLGLGTAATDAASVQNLTSAASLLVRDKCDFRLTLVSGNPVGSASAAVTLYATPYKGNSIGLYDGSSAWSIVSSSEFSIALGTLTSGLPYDVFCYSNAGVATLELLAWTNSTTRATALTTQDGVYVKTGATTRRYLGTFCTTSTTTTEDTATNRYLWNYYNRVRRVMAPALVGSAYNYTTATIRQANANTANQLNYVIGVGEDTLSAFAKTIAANTNTGVLVAAGLGLDSTSTFTASAGAGVTTSIANGNVLLTATYEDIGSVGKHFISLNEYSAATGTTTWVPAIAAGGGMTLTGDLWA